MQGLDAEWVGAARDKLEAAWPTRWAGPGARRRLGRRRPPPSAWPGAASRSTPWAEEPARALMRALADQGDRAAAMAAFAALRKRMARDLRTATSEATRELAVELRGAGAAARAFAPRRSHRRYAYRSRRGGAAHVRRARRRARGAAAPHRAGPRSSTALVHDLGARQHRQVALAARCVIDDPGRGGPGRSSLDCRASTPPRGLPGRFCRAPGASARDSGPSLRRRPRRCRRPPSGARARHLRDASG